MKSIIKDFLHNTALYIIHNPEKCLISFLLTLLSVLITATVGWIVYKKQQKIKYVQEDITNFFYIFYLIIKNFEEIINMYTQYSQPALFELKKVIDALNEIKSIGDKYHNKVPVSNILNLSQDTKEQFLQNELKKQQTFLSLKVSSYRYYWHIDSKDFSKEALFLTKYGDTKFQAITIILYSVYHLLNELNVSILNDINESRTKPATSHNEIIIGDIRNINYEENIYKYLSRIEYKLSLFETLNKELEKGIIYSRIAIEHLQTFYNAFYKKYKSQLKFIGVKYREFRIDNEIIEDAKYKELLKTRKKFEIQYWDIPDFEKILKK